jgi:hypothetical protein
MVLQLAYRQIKAPVPNSSLNGNRKELSTKRTGSYRFSTNRANGFNLESSRYIMSEDSHYAEARALLKLLLISGAITLSSAAILVVAWWCWK